MLKEEEEIKLPRFPLALSLQRRIIFAHSSKVTKSTRWILKTRASRYVLVMFWWCIKFVVLLVWLCICFSLAFYISYSPCKTLSRTKGKTAAISNVFKISPFLRANVCCCDGNIKLQSVQSYDKSRNPGLGLWPTTLHRSVFFFLELNDLTTLNKKERKYDSSQSETLNH